MTGQQQTEFGAGGVGTATIEVPVAARLGVQASGGALILSKGDSTKDQGVQATSTGSAYLGTLGVRLRAYGNTKVAGPWIDANGGVARTGDLTRPVFDAHLGWDFRVAKESRVDVGPFVGYMQVFQPNTDFRGADARVLTAGISLSLGAKERARPAGPAKPEDPPPPPPAFSPDQDKFAEAYDVCPDGTELVEGNCEVQIRVFEDRILVDDIHFAFDSATVKKDSLHIVEKVAKFINSEKDIVDISIEGHADQVGTEEYNQRLSEARARTMKTILVRYGVNPKRLRVVAYGKSHPKVASTGREAENRRVEFFVTLTRSTLAGSGTTSHAHGRDSL